MKLNHEVICYKPGTKILIDDKTITAYIDRMSICRDLSIVYTAVYWWRGERKEFVIYEPDIVLADITDKISIGFK
jgi:intergrase/recombinase